MCFCFVFNLDGRTICGRRARVEMSNGKSGGGRYRGPPPRRGRPFHPDDRCYECGDRGHYARDCSRYRRGRRRYLYSVQLFHYLFILLILMRLTVGFELNVLLFIIVMKSESISQS